MAHIPCPDCEHGTQEVKVGYFLSGEPKTQLVECETCKGEGEITERNPIEEVKIKEIGTSRWEITFVRKNSQHTHTGFWSSAYRLKRVLTELVERGEYNVVYEHLTRGVVTFYPAQLPY